MQWDSATCVTEEVRKPLTMSWISDASSLKRMFLFLCSMLGFVFAFGTIEWVVLKPMLRYAQSHLPPPPLPDVYIRAASRSVTALLSLVNLLWQIWRKSTLVCISRVVNWGEVIILWHERGDFKTQGRSRFRYNETGNVPCGSDYNCYKKHSSNTGEDWLGRDRLFFSGEKTCCQIGLYGKKTEKPKYPDMILFFFPTPTKT